MATLFTRIIDGEIPGRFVWSDEVCVAFLTIEPLQLGHVMVVPRAEVDQWVDLPAGVAAHVFAVAQAIGTAQRSAFDAARIGMLIQGYEIPHTHVHVWPSRSPADFDLGSAMRDVPDAHADHAAATLRAQLRADGHAAFVPGD
ncbi:HIT family protein [Occultella glacieicola]|uniref:HIT family protein n=1 Tax=Occultella glacieicola TaxID=2518684 RepID=A0ABY2DY06_9MICO|nr:HIT family protein [Occultella glacieicola]TDE88903.1 HIT family protein [Occultella glacieicola]